MTCHVVVLDADWFVHGGFRLVKQLAFCDVKTKTTHLYKLTLPRCLAQYGGKFAKQSRHSHGLDWSEKGEYMFCRIDYVLADIAERLGKNPAKLCFWAKGAEKADILSAYGYRVKNLEDLGCPPYDKLSSQRQSTMLKAVSFAVWLEKHVQV